jgi:hypothetical protein
MKLLLKIRDKKTENFKVIEKVSCDLSFGPIKFKKYNNNNVLQKLLEKRKQHQNNEIPRFSQHKKKLNTIENNIKIKSNDDNLLKNKLKINTCERTISNKKKGDLDLNNIDKFLSSFISTNNNKQKEKKCNQDKIKKLLLDKNYIENKTINENDNLPLINTMTVSTDKDKSNLSSFLFKNYNSNRKMDSNLTDNYKTLKLSTEIKNNIRISKRRDNTLLHKKDQTKEEKKNQKKIINSIKGLFENKSNKKELIFQLLNKKIYEEKLLKI